jgi:Flp pilus assembly pilin Flp
MKTLRALWSNDEGANIVEYALLVALIGIVAVAAVKLFGTWSSTSLNSAALGL